MEFQNLATRTRAALQETMHTKISKQRLSYMLTLHGKFFNNKHTCLN